MAQQEVSRSSDCLSRKPSNFSPDGISHFIRNFQNRTVPEKQIQPQRTIDSILDNEILTKDDIIGMNDEMIRLLGGEGESIPRDLRIMVDTDDLKIGSVIRFGSAVTEDFLRPLFTAEYSSKPNPESGLAEFTGIESLILRDDAESMFLIATGDFMRGEASAYFSFVNGDVQQRSPSVTVRRSRSGFDYISQVRSVEPNDLRSFFDRTYTASKLPPAPVLQITNL